jgi:hypothetical protein
MKLFVGRKKLFLPENSANQAIVQRLGESKLNRQIAALH